MSRGPQLQLKAQTSTRVKRRLEGEGAVQEGALVTPGAPARKSRKHGLSGTGSAPTLKPPPVFCATVSEIPGLAMLAAQGGTGQAGRIFGVN